MNGKTLEPFDLAGNFCGACGRAKMNRLFAMGLTGCAECDEVITRHRCSKRPGSLPADEPWECPDCGSVWTLAVVEEACPDCCGECDHVVEVPRWSAVPGDRIDSAPRYVPRGYWPLRNLLKPLDEERAEREAWIAEVAERLGLVRMKEK